MNRQQLFEYAQTEYGTQPDYPWSDENAVLRHRDNKWYALIMRIPRCKLGIEGQSDIDVLNVKCDPLLIGSLRMQEGFHPAYHMNKEKWITIRLDGTVADADIQNLLEISYELTGLKSKKKK